MPQPQEMAKFMGHQRVKEKAPCRIITFAIFKKGPIKDGKGLNNTKRVHRSTWKREEDWTRKAHNAGVFSEKDSCDSPIFVKNHWTGTIAEVLSEAGVYHDAKKARCLKRSQSRNSTGLYGKIVAVDVLQKRIERPRWEGVPDVF